MKVFKKILLIFGLIWLAIIFYFAGYLIGHKNFVFEKNYRPKLINTELKKPQEVDFSIFWQAWDIIGEKYIGTYSVKNLVYGAVKGMVDALGDPYSSFMEPSENRRLLEDLSGQLEGIGAELAIRDNKLMIIAPLDSSPAQKAGLKPQDQILEIDGEDSSVLNLEEAVLKIRGKAGTQIKLLISRKDFLEPREFTIVREKIAIHSVSWELKGGVGYIKISQFGEDTADLAQKAARELAAQNPKAIILDLRNNSGGYLDASIDVASLFVPEGSVIVKEEYKDGRKEELKTTSSGILKNYKIIVLVNEGSASASEIVASALQDLRQATLVGQKTFGKGTVQELEDLGDNAYLRITIAKWLTPNDRLINKEGIKPDQEVTLSEEDESAGRDPQLDKALELAR